MDSIIQMRVIISINDASLSGGSHTLEVMDTQLESQALVMACMVEE